MADGAGGIPVPGIQASFGLDTAEAENALTKIRSAMDSAADRIRAVQKEFTAGTASAVEYAKEVKKAESEQRLLQQTADKLTAAIEAQRAAVAQSISFSNDWTKAIQQGSQAAEDFKQQIADMAALQSHLGQMEHRQLVDETERQAAQEMLQLQAALGAMEQRSAAESVAASNARVQGLQKGVAALQKFTDALDKEIATEQQRLAEIAKADAAVDFIDRLANGMNRAALANETAAPMMMRSKTAIDMQNQAFQAGIGATFQYSVGLQKVATSQQQLNAESRRAAMAMMQMGYIIDDIQYGFHAVVNNIGPLVLGLSGNAGVAAGAQVASVAAYQLYTHWQDLMEVLGTDLPQTEAERMEYLAQKTHKTAEETAEYNKLKREQLEIERMLEKRPPGEEKSAKAAEKAAENAGNAEIAKGIAETRRLMGQGAKLTPSRLDKLAFEAAQEDILQSLNPLNGRTPGNPDFVNIQKIFEEKVKKEIDQEETNRANQLLHDIGDEKMPEQLRTRRLRQLIGLVNRNPGAFPSGLLKDLEDSLPENRKHQAEIEAQGQANAKQIEQNLKDKKSHANDESKHEAEAKQYRAENLRKAREALPEADEFAEGEIARQLGMGKTTDEAVKSARGRLYESLRRHGFSESDAQAGAEDLANEGRKRRANKEARRELKRMTPEGQRELRAEALRRAEEVAPGIGGLAEALAEQHGLMDQMGIGHGNAADAIREELKKRAGGQLSGEELDMATQGLMKKGNKSALQHLMHSMMGGGGGVQEESRNSEVFDASEINRRVQSAVGGTNHGKQQVDELKKVNAVLQRIQEKVGAYNLENIQ